MPTLYKKNETNFNHNGLGKLTHLLVYEIDEVLNGEFEALFEYPANGRLAKEIDNEMLIKAKPNRKDDAHVFKIYDYELNTFNHTYLIYARSKNIEDLKSNMILGLNIRDMTPTQAWSAASTNAVGTVNTSFYSDISTKSSTKWERRTLLSAIAGEEGSMVQYWGGEIKHDIDQVSLYRRRGRDNVTTVRHGKNLSGLSVTYSTKGLVTAIIPYYPRGADKKGLYGDVVHSKHDNSYSVTYYDVVEYNNEDLGLEREDEPEEGWGATKIKTELNRVAREYFVENVGVDLPTVSMKIALEDLSQTKEYERFKDFEQVELGDTITVYSKKHNLKVTAKVGRVVYNGLTNKNEIIEVGTAKRTLYDDVRQVVNRVNNELQEGVDNALTSANGKNTNFYGTADPNETGLVGKDGDLYFRTNGQEKEMWIYRDGMWHLETSDKMSDEIKQELERVEQEMQEARNHTESIEKDANSILEGLGLEIVGETHLNIVEGIKSGVTDAIIGIKESPEGTITGYNQLTENKDMVERIIGSSTESDTIINNRIARNVMTNSIARTEISEQIETNGTIESLRTSVTLLSNSWALRLEKNDDLVTAINATTKGLYLKGENIQLDGNTDVLGTFRVSGDMIAGSITADKVSGGTFNGATMNVINVNVDSLVGNTSNFIRSNWNDTTGGRVQITGSGIETSESSGASSAITSGGTNFYNSNGKRIGRIGPSAVLRGYPHKDALSILAEPGEAIDWARKISGTSQYRMAMRLQPDTDQITFFMNARFANPLYMSDNPILFRDSVDNQVGNIRAKAGLGLQIGSDRNKLALGMGGTSFSPAIEIDRSLNSVFHGPIRTLENSIMISASSGDYLHGGIMKNPSGSGVNLTADNGTLRLGLGGIGSNFQPRVLVGDGLIRFYRDLDMNHRDITNQSDIRLKDNVADSSMDALREIERLRFIEWNWKKGHPKNIGAPSERQFGVEAQYSPFLQQQSEDSHYLNVNVSKQINLNSKAIQELYDRVKRMEANNEQAATNSS